MALPSPAVDFELLFESAPISLWLEDYSALKLLFDQWRAQGVEDLVAHLAQTPGLLTTCAACYRVIQVNRKTLALMGAGSQSELLQRLPEVFRHDMHQNMVPELVALWSGQLSVASRSVNYSLDGRRIDVQVHVAVLPGYEATWERVMVSLEDISTEVAAQAELAHSERYARSLFDNSPVSLWVEDFSNVKRLLDEARGMGIEDFRTFISVHAEFVDRCMEEIKVLEVNQQTLSMFGARTKGELTGQLERVFRDEMRTSFAEQLLDLWNGKLVQMREVVNYSLTGETINIHLQFSVMRGHESDWGRVLVSLVDITARKKAEAYLEYLGKHDSLTRLRNRAFYVEELNRVSRKGPWPLSVLVFDLNGLKGVNDSEGHAAGDSLLRRTGEVLTNATQGHPYCVARVGGDEFAVLMPGCDERLAASLKGRVESVMELNNQFYSGHHLSLAIGHATCLNAGDVEDALHRADRAMFEAKEQFYKTSKFDRRHI